MFKKSDLKNSIWLAFQYIVLIGLSFLGLKLNLMSLGERQFGVWVLLLSFFGFGSVLDFGMGMSIVRWMSSKDTYSSLQTIATNALFSMLVSGIFVASSILLFVIKFVALNTKFVAPEDVSLIIRVSFLLVLSFYINYAIIFFRSVFEGLNNFAWVAKLSILNSITQFLCILLVFLLNLGIFGLVIFIVLNSFIQLVIHWYLFSSSQTSITIKLNSLSFRTAKSLFSQSLTLQGANLLGAALDPIIKYTIGIYANPSSISTFEIAKRFVQAFSGIYNNSLRNILPMVSALNSKEQHRSFLFSTAVPISRVSVYFSIICFSALSPAFLIANTMFFNLHSIIVPFLICILIESTNIFGSVYYGFLIGLKQERFLAILQLMNVIFVSCFLRLGYTLSGSSLGLLGYYLSVLFGSMPILFMTGRIAKISFATLWLKSGWIRLFFFHFLLLINIYLVLKYPEFQLKIQIVGLLIAVITSINRDSINLTKRILELVKV